MGDVVDGVPKGHRCRGVAGAERAVGPDEERP